jgi:hypothetical protein
MKVKDAKEITGSLTRTSQNARAKLQLASLGMQNRLEAQEG